MSNTQSITFDDKNLAKIKYGLYVSYFSHSEIQRS
jgi:hypothetical protein